MKRLLIIIEAYGLFALVALTAGAFVLAVGEALSRGGAAGGGLWEALLETLTADADKAEGWARKMHMFLTLTLGWAAVRLYAATVGLKWDTFSARHLSRDHVIIVAGRTEQGTDRRESTKAVLRTAESEVDRAALAVDLALSLAPSGPVVLSLPAVDAGTRAKLWHAGVTLLTEDIPMPDVLRSAGIRRARVLIAMRDAFGENVVLTRAAVSPSTANPALECKCMLEPLEVKREFKLEDYFEEPTLARIRTFNESELIARRILRQYPPDVLVAQSDQPVHVLLVGLGSVGQSVLVQLARVGHYRSGLKPKVTVVDRNVKAHWKQVQEAYPAIADWLAVETLETRIEDVGAAELERWLQDERPVTMIYVCTKTETANLRIARILLRSQIAHEQAGRTCPASVVALDPAGGCVLSEFAAHGSHAGRFHLFSLVRGDDSTEPSPLAGSLLSDVDDTVARQLHDGYCAEDDQNCMREPGRKKAPANRPWRDLQETYRDANRTSADHLAVKLRALGCKLVPAGSQTPAVLDADEIELLSRMEHDRWWADRALDGWAYAPVRDNDRKLHHNMVPYEELSDEVKKLDRDSVINMMRIMSTAGHVVVRA